MRSDLDVSAARIVPVAFFFLRHGETDWNAQGLSQGSVDIPLNAAGIAQAEQAASRFAGKGVRAIVSSDLCRARRTAEIVGERLGLEPSIDAGLREASFGEQEGRPMGGPLGRWYDDWVDSAFTPSGGESFSDLRVRVVATINRVVMGPGPVLVVAHGAMFRAVRFSMGLSAHVRTENGQGFACRPGSPTPVPWALDPVS